LKPKTKKQELKQKIIATLVITFMFMMVFGVLDSNIVSAIGFNSTLIQNFVAGTLQLEGPASLGFPDITVAVATNSLANLDSLNIREYRGTGAGWTVVGSMNNMEVATAGARNFLDANNIAWFPGNSTLTALEGASSAGIAKGANTFMNSGTSRTLINASTNNGMGNYRLNGTLINVQYFGWGNQTAGTYQNTLLLTIS
jgi:hypothetical protein